MEIKNKISLNYLVIKRFIAGSIIALVIGCTPSHLDEVGLKAYIMNPGHGATKMEQTASMEVRVTYRPTDLIVAQELKGLEPYSEEQVSDLKLKYNDYSYFVLSLSNHSKEILAGSDFISFSDNLQALSFRMTEFVYLTNSKKDTIEVADYVYPRTFGMGQATNLMFAFNNEKLKGNDWIQFNFKEMGFGVGNRHFRFKTSDINKIPKLNF